MSKPVVIIGAGPAGLSCASRLIALGETVIIIDDNVQAGGQYFRQLPRTYKAAPDARLLRETRRAGHLAEVVKHHRVRYLPSTTAWASPHPLTIAYTGIGETGRIEAKAVIIATGAHDKPFPFPGWTLPGVISAGGCLNLAKGNGLVPGGKVVVAGNGPLVLVVAATLAAAGAEVTHVLESQVTARLAARLAARAFDAPSLLFKGLGYRARIARAGAHFLPGMMVVQATGTDGLQEVEIAPVGVDGRPSAAGRKSLKASTLVIGYGLTPSAEFSRLLGCTMRHSRSLGGWVPVRSENFLTSVPGVYAVGDGAGIGGVEVAIMEGALVADAVVKGQIDGPRLRAYRRLDRFRTALSESYQTPQPLSAADPDTIICRCEELRLADLTAAMEPVDKHLGRLKSATRLGMGRCQGRNCLASASALLGLDTAPTAETFPRSRPPARPVRIRDLIKDQSIGPAKIPDEAELSKD